MSEWKIAEKILLYIPISFELLEGCMQVAIFFKSDEFFIIFKGLDKINSLTDLLWLCVW